MRRDVLLRGHLALRQTRAALEVARVLRRGEVAEQLREALLLAVRDDQRAPGRRVRGGGAAGATGGSRPRPRPRRARARRPTARRARRRGRRRARRTSLWCVGTTTKRVFGRVRVCRRGRPVRRSPRRPRFGGSLSFRDSDDARGGARHAAVSSRVNASETKNAHIHVPKVLSRSPPESTRNTRKSTALETARTRRSSSRARDLCPRRRSRDVRAHSRPRVAPPCTPS